MLCDFWSIGDLRGEQIPGNVSFPRKIELLHFGSYIFNKLEPASKSQNVKNRCPWGPSYQFLKILNMESISSQKYEIEILDLSIELKEPLPPTHRSLGPTSITIPTP